jgi:alkylation response protein AidB-like acyl-CoA dehydrogenase
MTYRAPVAEAAFFLEHCTNIKHLAGRGALADFSADMVPDVLAEAGKFAAEVLAPLNRAGDQEGAHFANGKVTMPKGFVDAYKAWAGAGWSAVTGPSDWGGQGLPTALNAPCIEFWNSANMGFAVGPLVSMAAIDAFHVHGSEALKRIFLEKIVTGEWMATMQLTEPQAGSDLALLRTRAAPDGNGAYKLKGTKIFITYGEHDLTSNIVHFVLARLPDAPAGTKGISLFLVPKLMVKPDGSLGSRNDLRCASIEHKMGIHASPTCVMNYGDNEGATGFLIGEPHKGLACMFTMMNNARLAVGLQGVGIAERATQQATAFAHERKQGRALGAGEGASTIVMHPDVKRMLLTMRALTNAARCICFKNADALDRAHHLEDEGERAIALEEANLLTPVAKAFSTDAGIEVTSLGIQVHGGMGYIEETGAAQLYRDARIAAIYEGTNGIQAIDLVTRKITQSAGKAVERMIAGYRDTAHRLSTIRDPAFGPISIRLREGVDALERASAHLTAGLAKAPNEALAGATPYLRLFGLVAGGAYLSETALAARVAMIAGDGDPAHPARIATARFFAENLLPAASGLERVVTDGAASVMHSDAVLSA